MKYRSLLLLTIIFALSSCAVGRDYVRPEIPVETTFSELADGIASDPAVSAWWHSFNDPVLLELVSEAFKANRDLQGALAALNESRALRNLSALAFTPEINTEGSYSVRKDSSAVMRGGQPSFNSRTEFFSAGFDAVWEIDLFGRLRRNLEAADATEQASLADLRGLLISVAAEVVRSYLELRGSQAQLEVATRNVKVQRDLFELTKKRKEAGQVSSFDSARAAAQMYSTEAAIPVVEGDIKTAIFRLSVLIGQQPQALKERLVATQPIPVFTGPVTIGDPATLLQRRPDIQAAERRLAASTAQYGVAVAEYFPRVDVFGTIGLEAPSLRGFDESNAEYYSYGPRISWRILDFGRVLNEVDAADERAKLALATYEQTVLRALEDTESSLVRFAKERSRRASLKDAVSASAEATKIAGVQYESGLIDLLPLLDVQREALQNESQLVRSETQLAVNLVALFKSLGGGWEEVRIDEKDSDNKRSS